MDEGGVLDGSLGCSNCRDTFPVRNGFGDLRAPPRGAIETGFAGPPRNGDAGNGHGNGCDPGDPGDIGPLALQALLGISGGAGTVALLGAPAALGEHLATAMTDVQVVGIDPDLARWPSSASWSRLVARPGLPFRSGTLRAVALDGRLGVSWAKDALRACLQRGRLVFVGAEPPVRAWIEAEHLSAADVEGTTVVEVP